MKEGYSRFQSFEDYAENNKMPSYYDVIYENSSKIFEASEVRGTTPDQLKEAEKTYYELVEKLNNGEEIDEGFLSGIAGGAIGALAGPTIGKAICKVLGIDPNGTLGKLLTSRLVTTAMGYALGK